MPRKMALASDADAKRVLKKWQRKPVFIISIENH
jgi:hypothetical protein